MAESGAKAEDVPEQASRLVATLKATLSKANYDADWKLVTVLVGGNNLCIVCNSNAADQANSAAMYEQYLATTLATLATLPRTVVYVRSLLYNLRHSSRSQLCVRCRSGALIHADVCISVTPHNPILKECPFAP